MDEKVMQYIALKKFLYYVEQNDGCTYMLFELSNYSKTKLDIEINMCLCK